MNKDNLSTVTGKLLREKKWSLAVAESCTGGLLSKMLTDEAGASDFFVEGVTTYSNKSKQKRLGVRATTLKLHGAVSEETAREMARGLRKKTGADVSLSITGIAGPAGGSADKPVGLVYIGCSTRQRTLVQKYNFSGDRSVIRQRAALMALELLRKELLRGR